MYFCEICLPIPAITSTLMFGHGWLIASLSVYSWLFMSWKSKLNPGSTLRWRHNERDSVSNHQLHDCLLIVYSDADKEIIKAPRHWPLCGEFTGDRWIPRTNGQLRGKCFHLMTSSWNILAVEGLVMKEPAFKALLELVIHGNSLFFILYFHTDKMILYFS